MNVCSVDGLPLQKTLLSKILFSPRSQPARASATSVLAEDLVSIFVKHTNQPLTLGDSCPNSSFTTAPFFQSAHFAITLLYKFSLKKPYLKKVGETG